jgi:hypothetical protein
MSAVALGASYIIEEWKRIRLTNDLAAVLITNSPIATRDAVTSKRFPASAHHRVVGAPCQYRNASATSAPIPLYAAFTCSGGIKDPQNSSKPLYCWMRTDSDTDNR